MTHTIEFFAFPDSMALATSVARRLGLDVHPVDVHRFPDGESLVHAKCQDPGRALLFRSLHDPNEKLLEVLMAADALHRQGVSEIALVSPYLGYMRQDRVFQRGEPISQRVVADLIGRAFDHVLTIEAHLHRIQHLSEVFPCHAESISAATPIAQWLRRQPQTDFIIGPDEESEPWIQAIAQEADLVGRVASKARLSDRSVKIELPPLPDNAQRGWIVDDIVSSGGTLEALTRALKAAGVKEVGAIMVHALLADDTPVRLADAGLDHLVSTDSITDPTNEISLAGLLAENVAKIFGLTGEI